MTGSIARAPRRINFFFSRRGDRAAFICDAGGAGLGVGTWAWQPGAPCCQLLSTTGESTYSQPLALDDGRVLVLRPGADVHTLVLLAPGLAERTIGRIDSRGLRLLASPRPGTMAVAAGADDDGHAALWLVNETSPHIQAVPGTRLPARTLHGGHWLDEAGRTLGFDHRRDDGWRIVAADLATGMVRELTRRGGAHGDDRLLMSGPRSGRFLTARIADGHVRLGWGGWNRGDWHLTFPADLSFDGLVVPLAIDPAGALAAIGVQQGLRSRLFVCEPGAGPRRRTPLSIPPGVLWPVARWTNHGLHVVASGPRCPATVTTVRQGRCGHQAGQDPASHGEWAGAHAEVLAGPAGPVEAVIYGGAQWREAERLLIALHGGPHAAWTLTFDPLFQDLAAAGVAVMAPNQRGSTGYGPAHRDAIRGAWGGPDLADVRHLAESVSEYRRGRGLGALMLLGVSYGAFLALLAAAAAPALWSACVAVAPFCSARSLYCDGPAGVRSFLRRHGALDGVIDALGPRDLEQLAGRITARLLIMHGSRDETIPVSQSRRLVAALERAGRRSGREFSYQELPAGHDDPLRERDDGPRRRVVEFLTCQGRPS